MKNTLPASARFGGFQLNLNSGELFGEGQRVHLAEKPFRVLSVLLEHDGKLVTREDIQKRLWPNDTAVDFEHGINTAIKTLRRILGDPAEKPMYIETIPRRGYRLMTPVEWIADPGTAPKQSSAELADLPSTAATASRGVLTGRTVSHYRVLNIIGGGGMGVVYRAEDLKLGRAVALKFLPEDTGGDPLALERFGREARAVASLDNTNICAIYEFGEHEGHPFIVMQLLEGQNLRDRLAESSGPLPLEELIDIGIQVSHGLQAAHERGILHRDIKPANIFLTRKGVCKILDFGLAKLMEADEKGEAAGAPSVSSLSSSAMPEGSTLSRTGGTMGTAGYMSPEQVRGEKLDARSDLFSLGLVLYEMATGQRAFAGDTVAVVEDAILHTSAVPIQELNPRLPLKLIAMIDRALQKDRDARCQSTSELLTGLENLKLRTRTARSPLYRRRRKALFAAGGLIVVGTLATWVYWPSRRLAREFGGRGTVVIADFENTTGDSAFEGSMRQALALQMEQSPHLSVLSDDKVRATLREMEKPPDQFLTPPVAAGICLRTHSNAVLAGSIARRNNSYDLVLKAMTCQTTVAFEVVRIQAENRNQIMPALSSAANQMRSALGESLASVGRYDEPLLEATTSSLEALQAFSKAGKYASPTEKIPYLKRALELDPNFAYAYAQLGAAYWNVGEGSLGARNITTAFRLREKASPKERFYIETTYYGLVTRELENGEESAKEWTESYPESWEPHNDLAIIYAELGKPDDAVREIKEVVRLVPENPGAYANLVGMASAANLLDLAQDTYNQARDLNLDSPYLREYRYNLAFLQGDDTAMQEQLRWAAGKPRTEDVMLAHQADTEAFHGRILQSRIYSQRAVHSAKSTGAMESASGWMLRAALQDAELGDFKAARHNVGEGLAMNNGRDARIIAALVFARTGDVVRAEALSSSLKQEFPLDTVLENVALPCIRAAVLLQEEKPLQALEVLSVSYKYELSQGTISFVYPAYLRGEAYLKTDQPDRAVVEFQKLSAHRGIVGNFVTGALVYLQLGRAEAMKGNKAAAVTYYGDFLRIWHNADPDIPAYRQAEAEYRKLK